MFDRPPAPELYYQPIVEGLRRKYGVFQLPSDSKERVKSHGHELANFFLNVADVERLLDVIELTFNKDFGSYVVLC